MQETMCRRSRNIGNTKETMCRRSRNVGRHNVQEIKEHDRELEHVQEKMCRITGNKRRDRTCARDTCRTSGDTKER